MNINKSMKEYMHCKGLNLTQYGILINIAQSSLSVISRKNACSTRTLSKLAHDMKVSDFIKLGEE